MQSSDVPTPLVLDKYYAFNEWTQDIFERNEIYFQSPDCLNDPFDSKIHTTYEGTEEQRVSRLIDLWRQGPLKDKKQDDLRSQAWDIVRQGKDIPLVLRTSKGTAERTRKQMGIFCMTTNKADILMWSHYANAHRGFFLGFKTENTFFEQVGHIVYSCNRPLLNLIEKPDAEKIASALFRKAEHRAYEGEWRIVDHERGPGVQTFPPAALCEVILGCRITPGNRHQVLRWCRERDPQPAVFWAEEKDTEFGLDIVRIS